MPSLHRLSGCYLLTGTGTHGELLVTVGVLAADRARQMFEWTIDSDGVPGQLRTAERHGHGVTKASGARSRIVEGVHMPDKDIFERTYESIDNSQKSKHKESDFLSSLPIGFEIRFIENGFVTTKGIGLLILHPEDTKNLKTTNQ